MICPNCGGEFADWALKCPYCGSTNEQGAESEYMKHMEDLRGKLDQLDEEARESYKSSMNLTLKKLLKCLGILLATALLLALGVFLIKKIYTQKEEDFYMAQKAWQKEEYKKLDALYEKGSYDEILTESYNILEGDYSISTWDHYCFITEFYDNYSDLLAAKEQLKEGADDSYFLGSGLYSALYLSQYATDDYIKQLREDYKTKGTYGLSEDEVTLVKDYQKEALDFLKKDLGYSTDQIHTVYKECLTNGYLSGESCYKKAEELAKSYGWATE